MAICVDVPGGYWPQPYRQLVPRSTSRRSMPGASVQVATPRTAILIQSRDSLVGASQSTPGRRSGWAKFPSLVRVLCEIGAWQFRRAINNIKSLTTSGPSLSHIKRSIPSSTSRSSHTRCQHYRSGRLHQNVNRRVIQRSHTLQAGFFALLLVAGLTGACGFDNLI